MLVQYLATGAREKAVTLQERSSIKEGECFLSLTPSSEFLNTSSHQLQNFTT